MFGGLCLEMPPKPSAHPIFTGFVLFCLYAFVLDSYIKIYGLSRPRIQCSICNHVHFGEREIRFSQFSKDSMIHRD